MSDRSQDRQDGMRRSEAFFGRRKSKTLSAKQQWRFGQLLPAPRIDPEEPAPERIGALFSPMPRQVILEIGFGGGEHLVHQANSNPDCGYIGVEPFVNSMAKALRAIEQNNLQNIRLYDDDAVKILDWLPASSIDRVDLLYPDPWPKFRHWKRRFVNRKNLDRISRALKPGGRFHFASDIATYVNWTLQHCEAHPDLDWEASTASHWQLPFENWIRTRYEAKALREGRVPAYLRFVRR